MSAPNLDPNEFLSAARKGSMSTQVTPCPEGTFQAQVERIDPPKSVDTKDGPRLVMAVVWNVLDDNVKAALDRDKITVRQDLWLDLDETGDLDEGEGKNTGIGQLREAFGMNGPDDEWSFEAFLNRAATIRVTQRSDPNNTERKFANVSQVAPAK